MSMHKAGFHAHGHVSALHHGKPPKGSHELKRSLRNIVHLVGGYRVAIVAVLLFAIGSTVFSIVGPKVLSEATTVLFEGATAKINGTGGIDFAAISKILAVTLLIYGASAACSFVQGWIMTGVSQRISFDLRARISEKMNRLSLGYFDRLQTGDVLSRITNDVDTVGQGLSQGLAQLVIGVVPLIGVFAMMVYINVWMALIAVLIIPASLFLTGFVMSRSQKHFFAQQTNLGAVNSKIDESFTGHDVIAAFGQEQRFAEEFDTVNDRLYDSGWKSQFFGGLMMPLMSFVSNAGYVAIAVSGALFCAVGAITIGDIQAFIQYVKNFTQPIMQMSQISVQLQQVAAASDRVFEFLEAEEEPDAYGTSGCGFCSGPVEDGQASLSGNHAQLAEDVVFDHVGFGYADAHRVINDFSAVVHEGQTVALVGPTGAGKSTIVKLLIRFYDPNEGSISIGGTDIREMDRQDLRSRFAMVMQDSWLFEGTIRENIRYGRPEATDEEVEQAARSAYAHHFIETLPEGYETVIGEDARNISQGQRQLLTIARAILADRKMIVLDEATSSVDTLTEAMIQAAMDELMRGRTSFVIAHRLSTIRNADLILVIREGDVVEQGSHDELLERDGAYAAMYRAQFESSCLV